MDQKILAVCGRLCWRAFLLIIPVAASAAELTLDRAVEIAIASDPWLDGKRAEETAFRAQAVAAGSLPDPQLSVSLSNLPIDTFSFSQEPMTQINIGVSQSFPGGSKLSLRAHRFEQLGAAASLERAARRAAVRRAVTLLWIEGARIDETLRLVGESRHRFEQLLEVTRARYNAATRRVRQQDVIRAQIELSRLDERLLKLGEARDGVLARLSEWLPASSLAEAVAFSMPALEVEGRDRSILAHPDIRALDQRVAVGRSELDLAEADRAPGWRINTAWGIRDRDFNDRELPDFFTVGVSIDLPLFRHGRQDQLVEAAANRVSSIESQRLLRARELRAERRGLASAIRRLDDQLALYQSTLLDQSSALSRSALAAYQADETDFSDLMRAYVSDLEARIDALGLSARRQAAIARLDYLNTATPVVEEK